jgi:hypothetical protein
MRTVLGKVDMQMLHEIARFDFACAFLSAARLSSETLAASLTTGFLWPIASVVSL